MSNILDYLTIHQPVSSLASLKAIPTASLSNGVLCYYTALGFYQYNSTATDTGDDDTIVEPDSGTGRWFRITDTIISTTATGGINNNVLISGNFQRMLWQLGTSFSSFTHEYVNAASIAICETSGDISVAQGSSDGSMEITLGADAANFCYFEKIDNKTTEYLRGKQVTFTANMKASTAGDVYMHIIKWTGTANEVTENPISAWSSTPTLATSFEYENSTDASSLTTSYADYSMTSTTIDSDAENLGILIVCNGSFDTSDTINILELKLEEGDSFTGYSIRDEVWESKRRLSTTYANDIVIGTANIEYGMEQVVSGEGTSFWWTYAFDRTMDAIPATSDCGAYDPANGDDGYFELGGSQTAWTSGPHECSEKRFLVQCTGATVSSGAEMHFSAHCKLAP